MSSSAQRRQFAIVTLRKMLNANATYRRLRKPFLTPAEVTAIIHALAALERRTV